ncbi:efflux transporter outer membrane subunit [Terricaulis sp.]|uniref:efflux transporter outer membrane subunit n=1 Tax=Terricaulis sp. TaxID=2768686 RepID=UPI002AC5B008|nr:efflux transporter outer membrane subunit [Terricaulis sp.]MDZ4692246.1 efflux transporter outer membrane subunit [Terricaulis sp.]
MMPTRSTGLAAIVAAAALAACSTMPGERPLSPDLPANWTDAPAGAELPVSDWWANFDDPALTALVNEALLNGPSVQQALLRVRESRALSHSTVAQYLPELSATGQGQYSRAVENGALPTAGGGTEREQMTGSYGGSVSWEIPLFSRIEAAFVGSRANTRGAVADVRAAQVTLAGDVAQAYVDLRAAQASRAALQRSVETADELSRILDISFNAGITSEADAADARRLAEATRARLPGLVIEERRAENVLAVLRGLAPGTETPETRAVLDAEGQPVPFMQLTQAPAAPADLIRLRPDVARAEAQAIVAAAGVSNARTDLLPRLNLTGSILTTDALIGDPLNVGGTFANGTPLISIPLFDWGARLARVRERDAQFDQALLQYRQVVTQAVAEASNALVALDQGRLRLDSARRAETAAETTARGSRAAYGAGIQSLTDRLRSEQQLIDANLTRIDAEAQSARAAIATYRAFGGGPSFETPLREVPSQ